MITYLREEMGWFFVSGAPCVEEWRLREIPNGAPRSVRKEAKHTGAAHDKMAG